MRRVLVADDACGDSLAAALGVLGFDAEAAETLEALERALALNPPDALVLDLRIPGPVTAESIVPWVRARYGGPIVLASGDDRAAHVARLHGLALVTKPHAPDALADALAKEIP